MASQNSPVKIQPELLIDESDSMNRPFLKVEFEDALYFITYLKECFRLPYCRESGRRSWLFLLLYLLARGFAQNISYLLYGKTFREAGSAPTIVSG